MTLEEQREVAQILSILGQKEVERLLLISRVTQLEAQVQELTPKPAAVEPSLEVVK